MAKSSSVNKVAKAAATSAPKASRPGDRPIFFPVAMAIVVVIGVIFVILARNERIGEIPNEAPALGDRWFSAYSINICGEAQEPLPASTDVQFGMSTQGQGLIHIEPLIEEATGRGAVLGLFFADNGGVLSDSSMSIGDISVTEGETQCDGEDGELLVLKWVDADAQDPLVISDGLGGVRFDQVDEEQGQLFTIAYVPIGAELDSAALKPDTSLLGDYTDGDPPTDEPQNESDETGG